MNAFDGGRPARRAGRLHAVASRLRHPRTTVRWRLTLLYGSLFLVCGAALLAITYGLAAHATRTGPSTAFTNVKADATRPAPSVRRFQVASSPPRPLSPAIRRLLRSDAGRLVIAIAGHNQRIFDLHQLEIESAIALAIMTVLSAALGWLVAGRVLRPVRTMTDATREISEASLHRRLAVAGPPDELRTLADTIDGLLARLEGAFDAQRRFVANASHELRTPLTASRALLEMVMSDPSATVADFRATGRQALEEADHQEQLIDALLTLAQGQQGLNSREPVQLAEVAAAVLHDLSTEAHAHGVRCDSALAPARLDGDVRLVERLVLNLVQNAIRHNVAGGTVDVTVLEHGGRATLRVSNSGAIVPADQVARLLAPFQRLGAERVGQPDGFGLGLSIVAAIADAHGAELTLAPRAEGGLDVDVRFPAATSPPQRRPAGIGV